MTGYGGQSVISIFQLRVRERVQDSKQHTSTGRYFVQEIRKTDLEHSRVVSGQHIRQMDFILVAIESGEAAA